MNTPIFEPAKLASIHVSAVAARTLNAVSMARSQLDSSGESSLVERLVQLSTELVDLAYELERRGRMDAADVASATAARLRELCARDSLAGVEIDSIREAF
jgi:hypothetical protein